MTPPRVASIAAEIGEFPPQVRHDGGERGITLSGGRSSARIAARDSRSQKFWIFG